jgi:glycosyltransferase involved in cell wall biosynthesis
VDLPIVFLGKPGPGSHGQEYYQDCKQLAGRRGNVYFIDFLPQQSLVKLFQHAAVHVLPSWSERPGQVTLEAIAYGCKSVSTIYSSISEYVGDNISYCDPNSPKSIREAIEQSLSTPFPTGLERYVLTNYTWEKNALGLLAHYQSLI